jgi:sugar phosphate isomerase/epimerase
MHLAPEATFMQQNEILERSIDLARQFNTGKVRCFDFWRLDDAAPYRAAMDEKLRAAAEIAGKHGILLVLENEPACNTATGSEAARTMNAIQTPHLALNWDAANCVMAGEVFAAGWKALPKKRIHHCHVKNVAKDAAGKIEWAPIDKGVIDWPVHFRLLDQAGYRGAVSLETHWEGGRTLEESTHICWAGMKQALQKASAL